MCWPKGHLGIPENCLWAHPFGVSLTLWAPWLTLKGPPVPLEHVSSMLWMARLRGLGAMEPGTG